MAFAGDQQYVPIFKIRDSLSNRLGTVANLHSARSVGKNGGTDRSGILAARVIVGNDGAVGVIHSDAAHERTLAGVAIAAGAKDNDQLAARVRTQTFERLLQGIRFMSIVDKNWSTVVRPGKLQSSLGTVEFFQRRKHPRRFGAGRNRQTSRDPGILHLEDADKRKPNLICAAAMREIDDLCEAVNRSADELDVLSLFTDGH